MTPTQRRASSSMTLDISDDKVVDDNDTKTSPIQQRIIDFSVNPAALNCKTYDCVPLVRSSGGWLLFYDICLPLFHDMWGRWLLFIQHKFILLRQQSASDGCLLEQMKDTYANGISMHR